MSTLIIEIRAAEGGEDAKLLVGDQFDIYQRWAALQGVALEILDERPGILVFRAEGVKAASAFQHEAGGHRWQRVPPTEKRGRVHTSTVTIAVLPMEDLVTVDLPDRDLEIKATVGSGAGGQNRNKTASAIQMKHRPSGLTVRVETERSQKQNLALAKSILAARLQERAQGEQDGARNARRKDQVGVGARGDKRRTIALQRGQVVDHVLNRRMDTTRYLKGDLSPLIGS